MRIDRWTGLGATALAAFAVLLILSEDYVSGPALLAIVLLVAISRVSIVERNLAGSYERGRSRLAFLRAFVLWVINISVAATLVVAGAQHWTTLDTRGRVAVWALVGFAWLLYREMDRRGDEAINRLKGSQAEEHVGRQLELMRPHGWEVVHNLKKDIRGNIDHMVWGDRGVYAIETKSGRFRHSDVSQAIGNALWVKRKFGVRWVTAVLCVGEDPPSPPRQVRYAWVLGPDDLVQWLQTRPLDRASMNLNTKRLRS
jgi:hypothetical protein